MSLGVHLWFIIIVATHIRQRFVYNYFAVSRLMSEGVSKKKFHQVICNHFAGVYIQYDYLKKST